MCEKPFATTVEDGRRMLLAIRESGVKCQMAHLFRFLPYYINAKNSVAGGNLGEILTATLQMKNRISVPTRMLSWAASSSPAWFLLAHAVDMLTWVCGSDIGELKATGVKKKLVSMGVDTYDLIRVEAELENGVPCLLEANWIVPDNYPITAAVRFELEGTEGVYDVDTGDPVITRASPEGYGVMGMLEFEVGGYYVGLRRHMLDAFARSVEYGAPLVTDAGDGFRALCVLDTIERSLREKSACRVEY